MSFFNANIHKYMCVHMYTGILSCTVMYCCILDMCTYLNIYCIVCHCHYLSNLKSRQSLITYNILNSLQQYSVYCILYYLLCVTDFLLFKFCLIIRVYVCSTFMCVHIYLCIFDLIIQKINICIHNTAC